MAIGMYPIPPPDEQTLNSIFNPSQEPVEQSKRRIYGALFCKKIFAFVMYRILITRIMNFQIVIAMVLVQWLYSNSLIILLMSLPQSCHQMYFRKNSKILWTAVWRKIQLNELISKRLWYCSIFDWYRSEQYWLHKLITFRIYLNILFAESWVDSSCRSAACGHR